MLQETSISLAATAVNREIISRLAVSLPSLFRLDSNAPGLPSFHNQPGREESPETFAPKPRALVVDDAPDITEMLAMLLKHSGYEVTTAFSGTDALAAVSNERFDVIISDIGMPGMNGYELAEKIRELNDYDSVPMLAVTGFAMYDDRDRALASGFNAFMSKPVNPLELLEVVAQLRGK